jgi:hypothetical protein
VKLKHADLIDQTLETQLDEDGKPTTVQAKVVKLMTAIYDEALEHGNLNASDELIESTNFIEEVLMDTDLFSFEERVDLRDRLEVIRLTLTMGIQGQEWGQESFDREDEDAVTEVAIPVLTADEFYEVLFDAIGLYLHETPEAISL